MCGTGGGSPAPPRLIRFNARSGTKPWITPTVFYFPSSPPGRIPAVTSLRFRPKFVFMTSRQVNLVMWTIVLSVGLFCAAVKCFGADFIPSWLTKIGPEVGAMAAIVVVAILVLFAGKSAARAVHQRQTSARRFLVFTLIGIGCTELAKEFSLFGLGGLLSIYGLIGLAIIGFKKLSQRKAASPVTSSLDQNKPS
jgi:hypothetical protein